MNILEKLYNFVTENEKALKDLTVYADSHDIINLWNVAQEDADRFIGNSLDFRGPDYDLYWLLYRVGFQLKDKLDQHFNDTRTRLEKYEDSLAENNQRPEQIEYEKQWQEKINKRR
jgi:hypothetical protein